MFPPLTWWNLEEYFSLTLERMYTTTQQHVPDVNKLHNFNFVCVSE